LEVDRSHRYLPPILPSERVAEAVPGDPPEFGLREPEALRRQAVFAGQRAAEHRRVVGVQYDRHSRIEQAAHRVVLHALDHPRDQIAGDAYFERNVLLAQVAQQGGVAHRGDSVADAFGAESKRVPDGFRPRALAGVRVEVESLAPGEGENVLEPTGGAALLAAADAGGHHAQVL